MSAGASDRADRQLVAAIRAGLRAVAEPSRAPAMQAYMKSQLPFLGVPRPLVRSTVRHEARLRPPAGQGALAATAGLLWRPATVREERYAATALCALPLARPWQGPALLPLYREMIVSGAWWDHVDETAPLVGALLASYPDQVRPVVLAWAGDGDRWLRRAAVICQLGARQHTDVALLAAVIDANLADPDFFVGKAIGWALRSYARTDPEWVRQFVAEHPLSPLSRREALKHLA